MIIVLLLSFLSLRLLFRLGFQVPQLFALFHLVGFLMRFS